jgi:hypothetical protein
VHVTPLGLCTHDFKGAPCPKMLNCVKDCDDYLLDTATQMRPQSRATQAEDGAHFEPSFGTKGRGERDLSENWIAEARATLAGVQRVLSTKPLVCTTLVRPFRGSGSRFEPLRQS